MGKYDFKLTLYKQLKNEKTAILHRYFCVSRLFGIYSILSRIYKGHRGVIDEILKQH